MLVKFNDSITTFGDEYQLYTSRKEWSYNNDLDERYIISYCSGKINAEIFSTNNKNLGEIVYDKIIDGILENKPVSFNFNHYVEISDDEINVLISEIE